MLPELIRYKLGTHILTRHQLSPVLARPFILHLTAPSRWWIDWTRLASRWWWIGWTKLTSQW